MMEAGMSKMDELFELLSHIDLDHERELEGPYNFTRLNAIHQDMHERREWDHSLEYRGSVNLGLLGNQESFSVLQELLE